MDLCTKNMTNIEKVVSCHGTCKNIFAKQKIEENYKYKP